MKLKLIITFFISVYYLVSLGQNEIQKNYLVTYGQVWGFLKYYHPEPSKLDWDQVLLDDFESVKSCQNSIEFDAIIDSLILKCGNFIPIEREIVDSLFFIESFEWLDSELLSFKCKDYLKNLLENKPNFKNKYVAKGIVGNPKITNETEFDSFACDPGVSFLSLTRYWNIINYYFPYREIIPENWNELYLLHLENFLNIHSFEDYYHSVVKLAADIKDAHAFVFVKNNLLKKKKHPPFECINVADGYYIGSIKKDIENSCKIKSGDKLLSVDGILIEDKLEEIRETVSASNDYYLSKATYYLLSTDSDSILIEVSRDGTIIKDKLATTKFFYSVEENGDKPYELITDAKSNIKYCYIDMGILKRADINLSFKKSIKKVNNLIIDCRNYPNVTLAKLTKKITSGTVVFSKFTLINFDYPGSVIWQKSRPVRSITKGFEGRVFILVDYQTMSQGEYTVMALQKKSNSVVIGGQTAGADGDVSRIPLPFGIETWFSGIGVYYPDGSETQQIGIKRDIPIVQDKRHVTEGKDIILEKALELMRSSTLK